MAKWSCTNKGSLSLWSGVVLEAGLGLDWDWDSDWNDWLFFIKRLQRRLIQRWNDMITKVWLNFFVPGAAEL